MNLHRLQNEKLSIAVSGSGAELKSLQRNADGREWMWQASPEFWPRTSPVLFPIVGKLRENSFSHQGRTFPLSQHGFARDRDFFLSASGEDFLRFRLEADEQSMRHYPFSFSLDIEYRLNGNSLQVAYRVQNEGKEKMPFSIGAHPGFSLLAWPSKKYFLEFELEEKLETIPLQDGLISHSARRAVNAENRRLEINRELFQHDALVFSSLKSTWIGISADGRDSELRLHFSGFPFLGIWSKPAAPFVCIEPWYGHADPIDFSADFSEKPGIRILQPSAFFECSFSIEILPGQ